jgi:hypothetical protein
MEPLLFGTIGTSIQYAQLAHYTIGRAVAIVCAGARAARPRCSGRSPSLSQRQAATA